MKRSKDTSSDAFSEAYEAALERARFEGYRQALDDQERRMRETLMPLFNELFVRLGR